MGFLDTEFQESEKGSITPGKHAQTVLRTDDIFTIDPAKTRDVKALKTFVASELVRDANTAKGHEPSNRRAVRAMKWQAIC